MAHLLFCALQKERVRRLYYFSPRSNRKGGNLRILSAHKIQTFRTVFFSMDCHIHILCGHDCERRVHPRRETFYIPLRQSIETRRDTECFLHTDILFYFFPLLLFGEVYTHIRNVDSGLADDGMIPHRHRAEGVVLDGPHYVRRRVIEPYPFPHLDTAFTCTLHDMKEDLLKPTFGVELKSVR